MTCSRFRVLARSYATQEAHSIHSPMYDPGLFISIPVSCALSSYPGPDGISCLYPSFLSLIS